MTPVKVLPVPGRRRLKKVEDFVFRFGPASSDSEECSGISSKKFFKKMKENENENENKNEKMREKCRWSGFGQSDVERDKFLPSKLIKSSVSDDD